MKKTYTIPSLTMVQLGNYTLLAGSEQTRGVYHDETVNKFDELLGREAEFDDEY
jgi:hypothetical protein